MKKCIADNCDLLSINQGISRKNNNITEYCRKHYYRVKRNGSENIKRLSPNKNRGCLISDCDRPHISKGYCSLHYKKIDRTKCILKGCNKNIESKKTKLCSTHQNLLRNGADFDSMIEVYKNFNGECAICKSSDPKTYYKKFHTDHDHKTGKVRGLLCDQCNKGLGHFKDNIYYLESAIRYLNESIKP